MRGWIIKEKWLNINETKGATIQSSFFFSWFFFLESNNTPWKRQKLNWNRSLYSLLPKIMQEDKSSFAKASKFSFRIGQFSTQKQRKKKRKKGIKSLSSNSTKPNSKPNESAHQLNRKDQNQLRKNCSNSKVDHTKRN